MLILLMVTIHPGPAVAEVSSPPILQTPAQATTSPRRGLVTSTSNLRASPSMQSPVVTIAREGAHVEILMEDGRWYHVRSDEGVEAWIYSSLVRIEQEPIEGPSATPVRIAQPGIMEHLLPMTTKSDVFVEFQPENTSANQQSGASSVTLIDALHVLSEKWLSGWFINPLLSDFQGRLAAYVIIAFVLVLMLSVTLQLRAARQLRRTMQEMGQILDIVEEFYAGSTLAWTNDRAATLNLVAAEALAQQNPQPALELSPIENAVLEVLSNRREVSEPELGKLLAEGGFTGVLIKAVIGDIIRKTEMMGLPWVEVRYARGQYSYRLRPATVPKPNEQQLNRP